jgi:hypothetical protein
MPNSVESTSATDGSDANALVGELPPLQSLPILLPSSPLVEEISLSPQGILSDINSNYSFAGVVDESDLKEVCEVDQYSLEPIRYSLEFTVSYSIEAYRGRPIGEDKGNLDEFEIVTRYMDSTGRIIHSWYVWKSELDIRDLISCCIKTVSHTPPTASRSPFRKSWKKYMPKFRRQNTDLEINSYKMYSFHFISYHGLCN